MLNLHTKYEELVYGYRALIVTIEGNIEKTTVRKLENQLLDYLHVGNIFLILDCSKIFGINSTGLQIFLKVVETCQSSGGIVLFIKVPNNISKFFDMLGFSPIFTSFVTKQEAINYITDQINKVAEEEKEEEKSQNKDEFVEKKLATNTKSTKELKTMALKGKREIPIHFEILYYSKMKSFGIFSLKLKVEPLSNKLSGDFLNIIPYFPGSIIIPPYRALKLNKKNEVIFWITPLAKQKSKGWVELWMGDESAHIFELPFKICSLKFVKIYLFLFFSFILLYNYFKNDIMPIIQNYFNNSMIIDYGYLAIASIFLFFAIISYFFNLSKKAEPIVQQLIFK